MLPAEWFEEHGDDIAKRAQLLADEGLRYPESYSGIQAAAESAQLLAGVAEAFWRRAAALRAAALPEEEDE